MVVRGRCEVQHDGEQCNSTEIVGWCHTLLKGYDNLKRTWVCQACLDGIVKDRDEVVDLHCVQNVVKATASIGPPPLCFGCEPVLVPGIISAALFWES